jgi:hypothetical protein
LGWNNEKVLIATALLGARAVEAEWLRGAFMKGTPKWKLCNNRAAELRRKAQEVRNAQ